MYHIHIASIHIPCYILNLQVIPSRIQNISKMMWATPGWTIGCWPSVIVSMFVIIWGSSFMFVWGYHFLNNPPHTETHVPLQYHVTWNGSEIRRVPLARGSCYIRLFTEFDMVLNIPGCALRVWHAKNVEKHVTFDLICSFHLPQQDAALDLGPPVANC